MRRRVIAASDPHCGSYQGLTPPEWRPGFSETERDGDEEQSRLAKFARLQTELWNTCMDTLDKLAPYHAIFWLGDMVEGKGFRSGGTELLVTDRLEQVTMATAVCKEFKTRAKYPDVVQRGVYGTTYHVGSDGEDFEKLVADNAGWESISAHEWPVINGCTFDLKHKVGGSSVPHGKGTAMLKDALWMELWAARELAPRAKVILRGHTHSYLGIDADEYMIFACPALQGWGTKYGSRECLGLVHWGLMHFDIDDNGNVVDWGKHIVKIKLQTATASPIVFADDIQM